MTRKQNTKNYDSASSNNRTTQKFNESFSILWKTSNILYTQPTDHIVVTKINICNLMICLLHHNRKFCNKHTNCKKNNNLNLKSFDLPSLAFASIQWWNFLNQQPLLTPVTPEAKKAASCTVTLTISCHDCYQWKHSEHQQLSPGLSVIYTYEWKTRLLVYGSPE